MQSNMIDLLRKIVKEKQAVDHIFPDADELVTIDMQSANAMLAVYDVLKKPENKKKFETKIQTLAGFLKLQSWSFTITSVKQ